jgi:SAM-dependent methyltransferase
MRSNVHGDLNYMDTWNFYRTDHEVRKSRARTEEWTIPAIRRFCNGGSVRLLSVGCGSAVDVAVLRQHGYLCWGADPDENCYADAREFFVQSDACSLPFHSEAFDLTMCLESFEHIGVPNTNTEWKPSPEYRANRRRAAEELLRVTKPGGVVVQVTPNRFFPIDEHGKGKTGIRWHLPFRDLTLSYFELRSLFLPKCDEMGVLPYGGYYELEKLKRLGGVPLVRVVKSLLPIFSNRMLHVFGPHLFVYFRKKGRDRRSDSTEARQRQSETRTVAV